MGGDSASNWLYYGDNLDILRERVADGSVDLVYLDPPFNSRRSYNVIFDRHGVMAEEASAQIHAFDDTWHWTPLTEQHFQRYMNGGVPGRVADALEAFRRLLGENDAMAYLVNMAPRLVELRRVLKPAGSMYLHCDPTMSHYLKVLLDAIFGPVRFRNEVIWKRTSAHSDARQGRRAYGSVHDVLLYYAASEKNVNVWNPYFTPYSAEHLKREYRHAAPDGRRYIESDLTAAKPGGDTEYEWRVKRLGEAAWVADLDLEYLHPKPGWSYHGVRPYNGRYWAYSRDNLAEFARAGRLVHRKTGVPRLINFADEMPGVGPLDVWTDIPPVIAGANERLGYPTQKPLALLERIIRTSSTEGATVLDPFCGCGTAIDAAQRLGRKWIGIDITFIAIDLIRHRLRGSFPGIDGTYATYGIPGDLGGARDLFSRSAFDFERWAVSLIGGQPNEKQRGDKGIDGVVRFYLAKDARGRVLISVKGGQDIGPQHIRDLLGTVETQKAQMGVLVTLERPTRGMIDAADHGGTYTWPITGHTYPRLQIMTIKDLLAGRRPNMPAGLEPYPQVHRVAADSGQLTFGDLAEGTG